MKRLLITAHFRMRPDGGPIRLVVDLPQAVQNPGGVDLGPAGVPVPPL
jgi:hypothetical protein